MADKLPVINLDEDPDNANWIRIIAAKREAAARAKGENADEVPAPTQP